MLWPNSIKTDCTRVCGTSSSILDLVFVSPRLVSSLVRCEVEEGLSDHKTVVISLKATADIPRANSKNLILDFQAADDVGILDFLKQSLDQFLILYHSEASTDELWSTFADIVHQCIERFVPKRHKIVNKKSPWMTREIKHIKRKPGSVANRSYTQR